MRKMKCPSCKKYNFQEGDKFCEHCGNILPPRGAKFSVWDPKRARSGASGAVIAVVYILTTVVVVLGITWFCLRLTGADRQVKSFIDESGILQNINFGGFGVPSGRAGTAQEDTSSVQAGISGNEAVQGDVPEGQAAQAGVFENQAAQGGVPVGVTENQAAQAEVSPGQEAPAAAEVSTQAQDTGFGIGRVINVETEPQQQAPLPAEKDPVYLSTFVCYVNGSAPTLIMKDGLSDIYGNPLERCICGSVGGMTRSEGNYYLWGEYSVLRGRVVRGAGTNPQADLSDPQRRDITAVITGDGRTLYESGSVNLPGNEIQYFEIDVRGVNVLTISVVGQSYIRLTDMRVQQ